MDIPKCVTRPRKSGVGDRNKNAHATRTSEIDRGVRFDVTTPNGRQVEAIKERDKEDRCGPRGWPQSGS